MKGRIEEYVKRSKRYQNIDGTGEMYMGVMMLGFALHAYLQPIVPESSILGHRFSEFAFMYAILLPVLGLGYWGVRAIKRRITYPRTGYVAYRRDVRALVWAMAAGVGCAATLVLIFWFVRQHDALGVFRWMNAAVYVAAYALLILLLSPEHTWKWLVALFMALGLSAISLTVPGGMVEWFPPASLFIGLTSLVSGAITLFLYIRRTRPPALEAN